MNTVNPELWELVALAAVGCAAGFVNVMAGGGSLLTMPAMVLMFGFSGPEANGTNRIALLAQNVTSTATFHSKGYADFRLSLSLALCALPGAVLGAFAGSAFEGIWFNRLLACLMIAILIATAWKRPGIASSTFDPTRHQTICAHIGMVVMGLYGGFIQAGAGLIIMPILQRALGIDMVRVNMHKVFIIGFYTIFALVVFAMRGKVFWIAGLLLALGNSTGAWLATHVAIKKGERIVLLVFYASVIAMAGKLFISSS